MHLPSNYLKVNNYVRFQPECKQDIKIASLSDLHLSKIISSETIYMVLKQLEAEKAHYHCLLGDLIDVPSDLESEQIAASLLSFIKSSASLAPTLIVLGSHDFIDIDHQNHYNNDFWNEVASLSNVYLLNDEIVQMKDIFFMGYLQKYDYWYPKGDYVSHQDREDLNLLKNDLVNLKKLYSNLPINMPKVGLLHSPRFYKDEEIVNLLKDYNYLLCGHCHNGVLPAIIDDIYHGNRGLMSPMREFFPEVARGEYLLNTGTRLIINGGVSKIQFSASKLLWYLNYLFYKEMDILLLTGDEDIKENITRKKIYTKI